jgi:nucleosome assembly protein 1-like 1
LKKRFSQEMRDLERKFEPLYAAVCAARRSVVTGEVDPVAAGAGGTVKGIPEFWLRAMMHCRSIADFIEEHDVPVLKYLEDVTTGYVGDLAGFRLDFHFAPNPYFENAKLSKVFHIPNFVEGAPAPEKAAGGSAGAAAGAGAAAAAEEEEEEFADDEGFDVKAIDGCDIAWKSGKDVTVKITKKKSKGGKKGKGAVVVKEEPLPSFFRFFETPELVAPPGATEEEVSAPGRVLLCVCVCVLRAVARARAPGASPALSRGMTWWSNAWLSNGARGLKTPRSHMTSITISDGC